VTNRSRPLNIADMGNPVLEQAFAYFCRHLISLVCRCDTLDSGGQPVGKPEFFGFSGQILSVRGAWCLLTAGHIINGIEARLKTGRMRMQFVLADHFGPNVICHRAIPFDYESASRIAIDQDGLDFGLVCIHPHYRRLLEANGVVPISEERWMHQHKVEFDRHFMLGFPTGLIETEFHPTAEGYEVIGSLLPTIVYVTKLDALPSYAPTKPYQQFVGQIGHGGLHDIDGMSGCPIFGFQKGRDDRYWIVAVQNSWYTNDRIILGTPLPVLGQLIEHALQAET